MYYLVPDLTGKMRLICIRGSSKVESVHSRINKVITSGNTGPVTAAALLCLFTGWHNIEMGHRNGGEPDYGVHDLGYASVSFEYCYVMPHLM